MGDGGEVEGLHQVQFLHFRSFAFKTNSGSKSESDSRGEAYQRIHRVICDTRSTMIWGSLMAMGWWRWRGVVWFGRREGRKCVWRLRLQEAKHENTHGA